MRSLVEAISLMSLAERHLDKVLNKVLGDRSHPKRHPPLRMPPSLSVQD